MEVQKCVVWWVDENSLRVPTGLVNKFIIVINQLASGIWHTDATLYENRMNQTQRLGKEESKAATKKWTNYIWLFHWISLATFCHWLHQISLRLRKRHSPKLAHQNWQWLSHWNDSWISMDVRLIFLNCHPLNWIEIGSEKKVEIRQKKNWLHWLEIGSECQWVLIWLRFALELETDQFQLRSQFGSKSVKALVEKSTKFWLNLKNDW